MHEKLISLSLHRDNKQCCQHWKYSLLQNQLSVLLKSHHGKQMKKQGLGNFFRYRNLTKIITAHLLLQARLNPWEAICFMTNPFPKGVFSMELSPNFPFLMLKKQLLHIIYSIFITPSQALKCIKLLSRRSLLISPRSVCFSLGAEWLDGKSK